MREEKVISIIVPVYNVEKYLEKCVYSIINQTYTNLEILLIDDGSKDSCSGICDEMSKEDSRIKVIHKENGGVSSARNIGLDIASGEYVCFVDSDDWIEKDYVEKLFGAICKYKTHFSYCSFSIDEDEKSKKMKLPFETGKIFLEDIFPQLFFGTKNIQYVMPTGIFLGMFERDIIKRFKLKYDTSIRKAEDWLFYSIYMPHCDEIAIINEPLYHYVQNMDSVSHEYYVPSEVGIQKSLYILECFEATMKKNHIDYEWYGQGLAMRYATSVIRYAIAFWDKRNKMSVIEKHRAVKHYIKQYKIYKRLGKIKFDKVGIRQKVELWLVKSHSALLLDIYANFYLFLRRALR